MIMNTAGGKKVVDKDKGEGESEGEDEGEVTVNVKVKVKGKVKVKVEVEVKDEGDSTNRKQAIYDVVTNTRAALVLFQEFRWKSIRSPGWKDHNWPSHLKYTGHKEARILFDNNEVTVEECSQVILDDALANMPQGFAPISRMCLRKIKTKGDQAFEFICISWHGIYKMKLEEKKHQFESMLTYILKLSKKLSLPVILAGDFKLVTLRHWYHYHLSYTHTHQQKGGNQIQSISTYLLHHWKCPTLNL